MPWVVWLQLLGWIAPREGQCERHPRFPLCTDKETEYIGLLGSIKTNNDAILEEKKVKAKSNPGTVERLDGKVSQSAHHSTLASEA